MIKNKGILFSALASVVMMTACNSEEDVFLGESNELTGREIYATGAYSGGSNPQSRMSYEDDFETNRIKLAWSEGDAFSAFIYGDTIDLPFNIQAPKNGTYTANETFKCDNFPDIQNGTLIDAIYPSSVLAGNSNPKTIALSLDEQEQKGHKSTDHLKKYDYMVGHAIYDIDTPDKLDFSFKYSDISGRLASIYRIKMALPPTVKSVSKIEISCKDADNNSSLVTNVKVNIHNAGFSEKEVGKVTLDITDGEVKNCEFVAYVMLFPSKVKERTITVTAKEGEVEKTFTDTKIYETEAEYSRGEFKYINLNFVPKKNFKSEYTKDDFILWREDFCNYVPTESDMKKYLAAGVYWDNGIEGAHQQTYTVTDRKGGKGTYHTGLWVMKMKCIDELGISAGTSTSVTPKKGRPEDIDKYFFLPAAGSFDKINSYTAGKNGVYWSQSDKVANERRLPVNLVFNASFAEVRRTEHSDNGTYSLPMILE